MTPDDRDLPHVRGEACPRCHAHDGEAHGLRCEDAPDEPAATAVVMLDIDGVLATEPTYDAAAKRRGISRATLRSLPLSPSLMLELLDPVACARAQRVCDAAGAGYVLISTWCDLYAQPEGSAYYDTAAHETARAAHVAAIVDALAARGLTAPCVGCAPMPCYKMSDYAGASSHRRRFIGGWVDAHPGVPWCVIDDDDKGRLYGHLYHGARRYHDARFIGRCVHPRDGITEADADAAVAILRGHAPATCGPVGVDADGREVAP